MNKRLTEEQFRRALAKISMKDRSAQAAYGAMVLGRQQTDIADEYGCTKSNISQAVRRVWLSHLDESGGKEPLPEGYEMVVVVLPEAQAFQVRQWGALAAKAIADRRRRDKS